MTFSPLLVNVILEPQIVVKRKEERREEKRKEKESYTDWQREHKTVFVYR